MHSQWQAQWKFVISVPTLTLAIILCTAPAWGQVTDTLYLDSMYNEVKSRSTAKYLRVIVNYDSSIDRFNAIDFNLKGQKVFEGQLRFVNSGSPDGDYLYYFDNGSRRVKGRNKNAHDKDFEFEEDLWHPNGIKQGNTSFKGQYFLHNHFDTLGRQEVKNGNGECTFISYFDKTIHKGKVGSAKKEGAWLISDFDGRAIAKEIYRDGKLISGFRLDGNADSIPYKYYGRLDNVKITNKIEREIKRQIKEQIPGRLNQEKEISYTIHVKGNKIIGVHLLRDKFIINNKLKATISAETKYIVIIQGQTPAETVIPLKFKMKL